ncbi:hypothetical protein KFK09_027688 [Dendrobium nobile]|uniref:Uncharacterized protein n=1 Tax=Dendrobium nobile TaxID=94219 RepID=A0A8T3A035_DENNO|nr:hypothetical protein KFK09_027688 [Dendrobium nobile]
MVVCVTRARNDFINMNMIFRILKYCCLEELRCNNQYVVGSQSLRNIYCDVIMLQLINY